jgi:hypothetical protein
VNPLYHHFAHVISHGPATDCRDTIAMVMKLSGGKTDPGDVADWWSQWQVLKQAMKDNHPMVKLAAALVPVDPSLADPITTKIVPGNLVPASKIVPPVMPFPVIENENVPPGVIIAVNRDPSAN